MLFCTIFIAIIFVIVEIACRFSRNVLIVIGSDYTPLECVVSIALLAWSFTPWERRKERAMLIAADDTDWREEDVIERMASDKSTEFHSF